MSGSSPRRAQRRQAGARRVRRSGLVSQSLNVDGQVRTYLVSPPTGSPRPLLVVLHGAGGQAAGMVGLTDLARRGAQAGFATVFPDGLHRSWNDGRTGARLAARAGVDDAAFLLRLIDQLAGAGVADPTSVFVCGMSNGAFMSDRLARVAPERIAGIGLVAGTAGVGAPQAAPTPSRPIPAMLFHGDADPIVAYPGGPLGRGRRRGRSDSAIGAGRGTCLGAEALAADWARIAGCDPRPIVERLANPGPGLGVVRLTWQGSVGVPIVLHRIEGGGHTWPGGPQYLPVRFIGPVAPNLDATGILLGYFQWVLARRGAGPSPALPTAATPTV
jgi:polyhydroxybutyrate depolymerase